MSKSDMLSQVRNGEGLGRVVDKLNQVLRAFKQAELDLKMRFEKQAQDIERLRALLVENGVEIGEPANADDHEEMKFQAQTAVSDLRDAPNFSPN